ncbi:hypothetical protein JW766_01320 [Candidatus Dojkabacteria bacterium]|nr:hypothetical protein [Candidatus Dojkabacteria bacterium]
MGETEKETDFNDYRPSGLDVAFRPEIMIPEVDPDDEDAYAVAVGINDRGVIFANIVHQGYPGAVMQVQVVVNLQTRFVATHFIPRGIEGSRMIPGEVAEAIFTNHVFPSVVVPIIQLQLGNSDVPLAA